MNLQQAETKIINEVCRPMQSRALEMFRHMTVAKTKITDIDKMQIPHNWPINGDITFIRKADGKRVWLGLRHKQFKAGIK